MAYLQPLISKDALDNCLKSYNLVKIGWTIFEKFRPPPQPPVQIGLHGARIPKLIIKINHIILAQSVIWKIKRNPYIHRTLVETAISSSNQMDMADKWDFQAQM